MDIELVHQVLAPLGVGGILAAAMFVIYRRDAKDWQDRWKGQSDILMTVVLDNTKAVTTNNEVMRALVRKLDRE